MTRCPVCQTALAPDSPACPRCGLLSSGATADRTQLLSATQVGRGGPPQGRFDVSALFGAKPRLVIGRADDCDIVLPHPSVSRYHARLERRPDGVYLDDLGSTNGSSVGGRRVSASTRVSETARVGIGPFLLSLAGGELRSSDSSRGLRLEARSLEKVITLADGSPRKLLDGISVVVQPGEFVTLLGPSGSGKSTLMDALNGRRRPTGGQVLANGEDFYRHFDSFRQSLGYVPQKDIVHTGLTVERALLYTARLRLPPDTARGELHRRIEEVIALMELDAHRGTLVGNLSGGQIKRVSLGAELIGKPSLLYIDEATSGLDAGTEARMMKLFRSLTGEGRSIICITHNVDNVDQCHLALVLVRGRLVYYGPPQDAPRFFGVGRVSEIYDRVARGQADEWHTRFLESREYDEYVVKRLLPVLDKPAEIVVPVLPAEPGERSRLSGLLADLPPLAEYFRHLDVRSSWKNLLRPVRDMRNQFRVLTQRYVELIWRDGRGLRLLLLQAPIVAAFLLLGFVGKSFDQPMPLLRPLSDQERRTLVVLRAMGDLLDSDVPLSHAQKDALKKVKVKAVGMPFAVDGNGIVGILRQLQRADLSPETKATLESVEFTIPVEGEPITVKAAELVTAWKRLQQSKIPDQLLHIDGPVVPSGQGMNPRFTYILLFIQAMIVLWFGCNNAAKEIVKEEAIFGRERAVNLRLGPYLASKFVVLSAITIFHALLLMLLVYGPLEILARLDPAHSAPPDSLMLSYPAQFGVMALLAMTGVALGLLLSACVSSPDRANALLPYVLIPQMILGGGILSVNSGGLYWLAMAISPVYWGFRATHLGAHDLPRAFPGYAPYADDALGPCLALVTQTAVMLAMTWAFLRRKQA
jgi:ABC-type multidrug transport system ATPase subunit